jgi:hypothetical protein
LAHQPGPPSRQQSCLSRPADHGHQERVQAALARLRHRPLPTAAEALDEPFAAFPSWFLRIECDRCGKVTVLNEAHTKGRRGGAGWTSALIVTAERNE